MGAGSHLQQAVNPDALYEGVRATDSGLHCLRLHGCDHHVGDRDDPGRLSDLQTVRYELGSDYSRHLRESSRFLPRDRRDQLAH